MFQDFNEKLFKGKSNGDQPSDDSKEDLFCNKPQELTFNSDEEIAQFWEKNCKIVPLKSAAKVGDHLKENDHLMFNLQSADMWCHIKLFMVQGKYNIDALMDLKID